MKIDNPVTREFLQLYPIEAARILEQLPSADVAALLSALSSSVRILLITSMLPEKVIDCLATMTMVDFASLLSDIPGSSAAAIIRLLPSEKSEQLTVQLSAKSRKNIQQYLKYPDASAGALLQPQVDILLENITVADAIHRIERLDHFVSNEIYAINDAHQLVGIISPGRLLTSPRHVRLTEILIRRTYSVSAYATADQLYSLPGWEIYRRLPVVDRENRLLGALHFSTVLDSVTKVDDVISRDPLDGILSVTGLYWHSMANLLDSMLNIARPKGERQ